MSRGVGMSGDGWVGMSRAWVPNPHTSDLKEGAGYPPWDTRGYGWQTECFLVTAHKQSLGQGNIFAPVCHSVHRGEYLTPPWDLEQTPPRDQIHQPLPGTRCTPPGPATPPRTRYTHPPRTRYTPLTRYTPGTRYTPPMQRLGDTVNTRAVRILLECILV